MTGASPDVIAPRLEELRRKLLDLTRRNRLLNFRLAARTSIRIVDELADEVYRILVTDGKAMQLLSREEAPPESQAALGDPQVIEAEEEPSTALVVWTGEPMTLAALPGARSAARHRDLHLQTALEGERLQARLTYLARESRSSLEEQGCNTLYLALGMVAWQETGPKSVMCAAPLLFVPVELKRKNVQSRYTVAAFDDDILVNPCLVELARRQFGVELPQFDADGGADLDDYFARVTAVLNADLPGWGFAPSMHLGLFSFAKLLMYRDLESAAWPAARPLGGHALVQKLCGLPVSIPGEQAPLPDPLELDGAHAPADSFLVVDADASQTAAILAAKQGKTLVIEGPPGTGKSQTITNIIAECLAAGKTVLFVAEKAAALEVVKRRLDRVGLGNFVLEMHSRFSKRRAVLDELRRALAGGEDQAQAAGGDAADLARLRGRLNAYVRDLHAPLGRIGTSPFAAITRAAALHDATEAPFEVVAPFEWTAADLSDALEKVELLERTRARIGDPAQHPWRGTRVTAAGHELRQQVQVRHAALSRALEAHVIAAARLAELVRVPPPTTLAGSAQLLQTASWLSDCPVIELGILEDERWDRQVNEVLTWVDHGRARQELMTVWRRWFRDEAEEEFWADVLERRRAQAHSVFRFVQPSWYADGKRIQRALKSGPEPAVDDLLKGLKSLVESARLRTEIEHALPRFRDVLGSLWRGLSTSFDALRREVATVREAHAKARAEQISWSAVRAVVPREDRAELKAVLGEASQSRARLEAALTAWCETLGTSPAEWLAAPTIDYQVITARLAPLSAAVDALDDWAAYRAAADACRTPRLSPFLTWIESGHASVPSASASFLRQFWSVFADRALAASDSLAAFRGEDHAALVERFRKADVEWIRETRRRLQTRMRGRQPDLAGQAHRESRLGQLKAQMKLKRGGVSLRKLFEATGDVIQAIKPCFMMSPISVAQYLAPGAVEFDVVIFDEASQVEPADAFGAVARGRQLLLIGDDKQLPPTNFFNRAQGEGASDSAEVAAADSESILDVGRNVLPDSAVCSLRWHYRSLHQSLIAFSNASFYDGKLKIFPSPHADRSELGLVMRYVADGVYLRGEGQYNPAEARAVAAAVLAHARAHPQVSLGVGAFSTAQQSAIEDELERQRRAFASEALEAFFSPTAAEPFFVKNLETIQGDERDVIFLSVGYGRDRDGRLTMSFGPLNRDGGWRRLNVLVTRARRRCEVFSSIRHDEIRVPTEASRGVAALKEYLRVAEQGSVDAHVPTENASPARLEELVARAIAARGYEVHVRVGTAGFSVDVAVIDPDRPGRYLLGIECDGDTYAGTATARDRDRLRAEVLAGLGWNIARIWSADWFRRPALLVDELAKTVEELRRAPRRETEPVVRDAPAELLALPPAPEEDDGGEADQVTLNGAVPDGVTLYASAPDRRLGTLETLLATPDARLAELVAEIVEVEAPVHEEHLTRIVAGWFDTKAAARARAKIRTAVMASVAAGRVDRRDEFLWRRGDTAAPVRFRGGDCPVNKPDHIAVEEFAAASLLVLRREFGLPRGGAVQSTLRLLGFRRAGPRLTQAAEQGVDWLMLNALIRRDDRGVLTVVPVG